MAIKKVTFSFDVPITQLLGLIASGNAAMKIDVYGDDKAHRMPKLLSNGHAPKLLEGPKHHAKPEKHHAKPPRGGQTGRPRQSGKDKNGKPITGYNAILTALAKRPDNTMPIAAMRDVVVGIGLSKNSANSQVHLMRARGLARKTGAGTYQLTHKGLVEVAERGLVKPKKSAPATPASAEGSDNG